MSPTEQTWTRSHRASDIGRPLADRHYNRQHIGATGFVPPGRCVVLLDRTNEPPKALWVSSWPFAEYVRHAWAGAWMNSLFRNEGAGLSSSLITQAVAATRSIWGDPPPLGFVTFVDRDKTRRKRDPGRCYRRAGWSVCGETQGGLLALQLLPAEFPDLEPPYSAQLELYPA